MPFGNVPQAAAGVGACAGPGAGKESVTVTVVYQRHRQKGSSTGHRGPARGGPQGESQRASEVGGGGVRESNSSLASGYFVCASPQQCVHLRKTGSSSINPSASRAGRAGQVGRASMSCIRPQAVRRAAASGSYAVRAATCAVLRVQQLLGATASSSTRTGSSGEAR